MPHVTNERITEDLGYYFASGNEPIELWQYDAMTRDWYCPETGEVVDHIQLMNADNFGVFDNIPRGLRWHLLREQHKKSVRARKQKSIYPCTHENKDNITEFGDPYERYLCRDCGYMDPKPERKLPPTDIEKLTAFFAECDAQVIRWKKEAEVMKVFLKEVDDLIEEVLNAKSK